MRNHTRRCCYRNLIISIFVQALQRSNFRKVAIGQRRLVEKGVYVIGDVLGARSKKRNTRHDMFSCHLLVQVLFGSYTGTDIGVVGG